MHCVLMKWTAVQLLLSLEVFSLTFQVHMYVLSVDQVHLSIGNYMIIVVAYRLHNVLLLLTHSLQGDLYM